MKAHGAEGRLHPAKEVSSIGVALRLPYGQERAVSVQQLEVLSLNGAVLN